MSRSKSVRAQVKLLTCFTRRSCVADSHDMTLGSFDVNADCKQCSAIRLVAYIQGAV